MQKLDIPFTAASVHKVRSRGKPARRKDGGQQDFNNTQFVVTEQQVFREAAVTHTSEQLNILSQSSLLGLRHIRPQARLTELDRSVDCDTCRETVKFLVLTSFQTEISDQFTEHARSPTHVSPH